MSISLRKKNPNKGKDYITERKKVFNREFRLKKIFVDVGIPKLDILKML